MSTICDLHSLQYLDEHRKAIFEWANDDVNEVKLPGYGVCSVGLLTVRVDHSYKIIANMSFLELKVGGRTGVSCFPGKE